MSTIPEEDSKSVICSRRKLGTLWIAAFIMALAGAFMPSPKVFMIDTVIHLLIFATLSFIPMIGMKCRKTTLLFAMSMAPLGYLLEHLHMMITEESFNAVNALANNIGVLVALVAGLIVRLLLHHERCFSTTTP